MCQPHVWVWACGKCGRHDFHLTAFALCFFFIFILHFAVCFHFIFSGYAMPAVEVISLFSPLAPTNAFVFIYTDVYVGMFVCSTTEGKNSSFEFVYALECFT